MYCLAVVAVALISCVSGLFVPRATPPEGWLSTYLEPYDTYHTRYLALSCSYKHGTDFFDQCCHPLLATEDLSTRPAECDPALSDDDDSTDCSVNDADASILLRSLEQSATVGVLQSPNTTTSDSVPTLEEPSTTSTSDQAPSATATGQPALMTHLFVKKVAPSPNSASSNINTGGYATYFYQNGVAGACGTVHSDNDFVAAIDGDRYGNLGQRSSLCGKWVQITNTKNGKSVSVVVADACPTCRNSNSIDLSEAAFKVIAPLSEGIVPINWSFI